MQGTYSFHRVSNPQIILIQLYQEVIVQDPGDYISGMNQQELEMIREDFTAGEFRSIIIL